MIQQLITHGRENEISRNHNIYADSQELTPFAAMRDINNGEIRGFPPNLRELNSLQCEDTNTDRFVIEC